MGSRWGQDVELSVSCGVLNDLPMKMVLKLSDGRIIERGQGLKGTLDQNYGPVIFTNLFGYELKYMLYTHHGDPVSDLRCGFEPSN